MVVGIRMRSDVVVDSLAVGVSTGRDESVAATYLLHTKVTVDLRKDPQAFFAVFDNHQTRVSTEEMGSFFIYSVVVV